MKNQNHSSKVKKGFTIIEVVLVLAIAGLIFLMVFIALPALQGAQRDTQRKNDLSRINTQISNYQSSNKGKIPDQSVGSVSTLRDFISDYLKGGGLIANDEEYTDPTTGTGYQFISAVPSSPGEISYATSDQCPGSTGTPSGRNYTLNIFLEGQNVPYCIEN